MSARSGDSFVIHTLGTAPFLDRASVPNSDS